MDLTWYNTINKPALNPPPEIFGPVWAFMYTLIFISFTTFMYAKTDLNKKQGLTFFLIQLLLNFSWSPAFFYLHDIKLSFIIIVFLLIFIILTIISFYKVSRISAFLLIPYLLWVSFATYLNFELMKLN